MQTRINAPADVPTANTSSAMSRACAAMMSRRPMKGIETSNPSQRRVAVLASRRASEMSGGSCWLLPFGVPSGDITPPHLGQTSDEPSLSAAVNGCAHFQQSTIFRPFTRSKGLESPRQLLQVGFLILSGAVRLVKVLTALAAEGRNHQGIGDSTIPFADARGAFLTGGGVPGRFGSWTSPDGRYSKVFKSETATMWRQPFLCHPRV